MAMGNQNFRHLLRLVTKGLESIHIAADVLAGEDGRILIGHFFGSPSRNAGIHQYHLAARVNQIVLKTATIAHVLVKLFHSFLASKHEGLSVESVSAEFYCFDCHNS